VDRHLLLRVNAMDLSVEVVASTADLAASAEARVTFIHAVPDHASSLYGDAEAQA